MVFTGLLHRYFQFSSVSHVNVVLDISEVETTFNFIQMRFQQFPPTVFSFTPKFGYSGASPAQWARERSPIPIEIGET